MTRVPDPTQPVHEDANPTPFQSTTKGVFLYNTAVSAVPQNTVCSFFNKVYLSKYKYKGSISGINILLPIQLTKLSAN